MTSSASAKVAPSVVLILGMATLTMAPSITVTKIPASITARPMWLRYLVTPDRMTRDPAGTSRFMASAELRACDSADLDRMPKSEPSADVLQRGTRLFIGPRRTFMPDAVNHHVVELDGVRAGKLCFGLRRGLEKVQTHGRGGEILVAGTDLDIVAPSDDVAVQDCTHRWVSYLSWPWPIFRANLGNIHGKTGATRRSVLPPPSHRREIGATGDNYGWQRH